MRTRQSQSPLVTTAKVTLSEANLARRDVRTKLPSLSKPPLLSRRTPSPAQRTRSQQGHKYPRVPLASLRDARPPLALISRNLIKPRPLTPRHRHERVSTGSQ